MDKIESNAINIAKFILIIGVVFIHLPLRYSNFLISGETPIYDIVSARFFLMDVSLPALFLISGYLFFYKFNEEHAFEMADYLKKLRSRVKSILLPYFFWNCFWLIYNIIKNVYLSHKGMEGEIVIDSLGSLVSSFWAVGQGELPNAPIAPYTWFLRDVFVFAVLSPFYYFLYKNKKLSYIVLAVFVILLGFPNIDIPLLTPAIYIGGFLAYNKCDLRVFCERIKLSIVIVGLITFSILFYRMFPYAVLRIGVLFFGFLFVFKISLLLYKKIWINNLSKVATYLYLTHIFVLNMGMHALFSIIPPHNDINLVTCFFLNFLACMFVCISSFYLLKLLKANVILKITTGGRF